MAAADEDAREAFLREARARAARLGLPTDVKAATRATLDAADPTGGMRLGALAAEWSPAYLPVEPFYAAVCAYARFLCRHAYDLAKQPRPRLADELLAAAAEIGVAPPWFGRAR